MANFNDIAKLSAIADRLVVGALRARAVRATLIPVLDRTYRASMTRRFDSENSVSGVGGTWQPLSPWYRAWKEKTYPNRPILTLRGNLRASFTQEDHPQHVSRYDGVGTVFLGSREPKAVKHDLGQDRLPVRRLSGVDDVTHQKFILDVTAYFSTMVATRFQNSIRALTRRGGSVGVASQGIDVARLKQRLSDAGLPSD